MTARAPLLLAALLTVACGSSDKNLIGQGGAGASSDGGGGAGGVGGAGGTPSGTPSGTGGTSSGTPGGTATGMAELPCAPSATWDPAWEALEAELIDLINARRQAGGTCGSQNFAAMTTVASDPILRDVARAHAQDMGDEDYFEYTALNGLSWPEQHAVCGFGSNPTGQGIAAGNETAADVFDQLVQSEGNCVSLHATATAIGVGHYADPTSTYGHYWALYLGTP